MNKTFYSSRNSARASGKPAKDFGVFAPIGQRWYTENEVAIIPEAKPGIEISIKHWSGRILFTHKALKNTIAITLIAAASININLRGAYLQGAYLRGADLQGADLRGAYLQGADLQGAYLRGADLQGADLQGAYLRGAYLQGADLQGAYLRGADLQGADLQGAYLQGAYLRGADLQGADLQGAYLQGAYLRGAYNLKETVGYELVIAQTRILPDSGDVVGYKKCKNGVVVKLLIPESAKRCHAMGRKCRAEYAKVLEISGGNTVAISAHDGKTRYVVGETVHCDKWGEDWTVECSGGIHFFITKIEAENY